jgi:threonylcarbamoyladenosine tRNA methylthiotransferase MtaB
VKVHLRTFGCRANHYDSEAMRAMLSAAGCEMVESADEADVAIFNSCAVTTAAEAELRKSVRAAARRNPRLRSIVTGCAAALDAGRADRAIAALPGVTDVIPGADLARLARAIKGSDSLIFRSQPPIKGSDSLIFRSQPPIKGSDSLIRAAIATEPQSTARAVLRIQDGCDEHCTFCVTTVARGANRSRPIASLVDEAQRLAEWHSEIVITGIHIGTYGADIGASLGGLMQRLVRDVPHCRFRLSSIEATELDDALIDLLAGAPESLAPHAHAPLQSGSDRVLKRMGRHWYTAASYARAVEGLMARMSATGVSSFGLGADVIAGFPGESQEDHAATLALVAALPFTYLHVFPFSRRPEAPASAISGHLPPDLIAERAAELRAAGEAAARAHAASRAGGDADVVVVTPPGASDREGITEDYLTVRVEDRGLPRGARFRAILRPVSGSIKGSTNGPIKGSDSLIAIKGSDSLIACPIGKNQ